MPQIVFVAFRFLAKNFQGQCRGVILDPALAAPNFNPVVYFRRARYDRGQAPTEIRPAVLKGPALEDDAGIHGFQFFQAYSLSARGS